MSSPIIVALDYDTKEEALLMARQLSPQLCRLKVATTLYTRYGPSIIEALQSLGFDIFLDLKFHDIPQQVFGACRQAARMGVWMLTIHCAGGEEMMVAARDAVKAGASATDRPLVVGVTVLTSLSTEDLSQVGISNNIISTVEKMAELAHFSGIDGVVSSAAEAKVIREKIGHEFLSVTPGIRLIDDANDDQKRVMTPEKAIKMGSDYLVIGRSITRSPHPAETVETILTNIHA